MLKIFGVLMLSILLFIVDCRPKPAYLCRKSMSKIPPKNTNTPQRFFIAGLHLCQYNFINQSLL
jgi:hypothetical protein